MYAAARRTAFNEILAGLLLRWSFGVIECAPYSFIFIDSGFIAKRFTARLLMVST
jgi:hypothetical protein